MNVKMIRNAICDLINVVNTTTSKEIADMCINEIIKSAEDLRRETHNRLNGLRENYVDSAELFIDEKIDQNENQSMLRNDLYGIYVGYCNENNLYVESRNHLYELMREKGYRESRLSYGIVFRVVIK